MIGITFNVENIDLVLRAYNQIQCMRYTADTTDVQPDTPIGQPIALTEWATVSGTADYPFPIDLESSTTTYVGYDPDGEAYDWYSSRYYDSTTGSYSAWSAPQLGEEEDIYFDPTYLEEETYDTADQTIIDKIRLYVGDPIGLSREFGEEAFASIHPDGKTFQLAEKGWPAYITMGGKGFTSKYNPTVNGYRYLKFQEQINELCYECVATGALCDEEGVDKSITHGVDIWYYTFRNSDRELMEAYDLCAIPPGLTDSNVTIQAYILQTAITIVRKELLEDATEDGAKIDDDPTSYDPSAGLAVRKALLDDLQKDLDALIKALTMAGITGVLID